MPKKQVDPHEQLNALAGKRATIDTASLKHLGIKEAPSGRLGSGAYNFSGETRAVGPTDQIHVRQGRVKVAQVREYLDNPSQEPIQITDRQRGAIHHVNGLHRLVAARLRGESVQAQVWR